MLDPIVGFFTWLFQWIGRALGFLIGAILWPFMWAARWYWGRGWMLKGTIGAVLLVLVALYGSTRTIRPRLPRRARAPAPATRSARRRPPRAAPPSRRKAASLPPLPAFRPI